MMNILNRFMNIKKYIDDLILKLMMNHMKRKSKIYMKHY